MYTIGTKIKYRIAKRKFKTAFIVSIGHNATFMSLVLNNGEHISEKQVTKILN